MKKNIATRILAVAVALTTLMSVAACGSKTETETKTETATQETSASEQKEEVSTDTGAAEETAKAGENPFTPENPGTLSVAVYDRSNMSSEYGTAIDNYWVNLIKEEVLAELNINVEFVAVPRSGAEDTMTTMLAGQNAPDIIFYYDTDAVADFVNQGGLADLTEAVDLYGANLKESLTEVLSYGQYDGVQYAIPAKRSDTGHLSSFIRKDWLDKIGYELKMDENGVGYIPTSDLYDIMVSWKEQGICEYPMGLAVENGTEAETMSPIYLSFVNHETVDESDVATLPDFMWDGVKDGFAYMNKLYNEGLIQPDWAQYTNDETEFNNWIATGKVGFWSHAYWQGLKDETGFGYILAENDPDAVIVPVCLTDDAGTAAMIDRYAPYGMFVVVPSYSEHVTEAVMYLNWMAEYENYETINYGFEGEHYVLREDGSHDNTQVKEGAVERISTGDLILTYNGNPDKSVFLNELITDRVHPRMVDTYTSAYHAAQVNTYEPYLFSEAIESVTDYSASLGEKMGELRVKCITCPTGEFEQTWETLCAEYLEMGGQTVIDDKTAAYNAE